MADGNYNGNGQYEQSYDQAQPGSGDAGGDKIKASRNDDDERKIFVGGLSWETSEQQMREYFAKYGEVSDCTLKTDPNTGRSRGFGFVLFADASGVAAVMSADTPHTLHGRTIDPKKANPRGGREPIKKIFVGGLDPDLCESDIKQHFEQFGKVEEVVLPYDKIKNQRRAFGFITFESEEVVDIACVKAKQTIGNKEVDVRKATPKTDQGQGGFGGRGGRGGFGGRGGGGGYGGRGGGRGGYDQSGYGGGGYDYYNQGYGAGYDYSQGYGGNGGYDYNSYYGQGWGGQGYGGGYGGGGGGGGYSGTQQNKQFGSKRGGGGGGGYHPYSR